MVWNVRGVDNAFVQVNERGLPFASHVQDIRHAVNRSGWSIESKLHVCRPRKSLQRDNGRPVVVLGVDLELEISAPTIWHREDFRVAERIQTVAHEWYEASIENGYPVESLIFNGKPK